MNLSTAEILDRAVARGDFGDITAAAEAEKAAEAEAKAEAIAEEQAASTADLDETRALFAEIRDRQHEHLLAACDIREEYLQKVAAYKRAKRRALAAGVPEQTPEHDVVTASRPLSVHDLRKEVERIGALLKSGIQ